MIRLWFNVKWEIEADNSDSLWITNPGKVIKSHFNTERSEPGALVFLMWVLRISGGKTDFFLDIISVFEVKLTILLSYLSYVLYIVI